MPACVLVAVSSCMGWLWTQGTHCCVEWMLRLRDGGKAVPWVLEEHASLVQ